jgi:phosphate:Na+ symporter
MTPVIHYFCHNLYFHVQCFSMDLRLWSLLGGIGLFLTGMYLMEGAIGLLAGRRFKLLIRRHTSNPVKATISGVIITAVLQSSSLVSFIVLAFAGNGILRLRNALAVILGANIGTTISNWLIATMGFTFNIDIIWFPVLGLAGIILFIYHQQKVVEAFCHFFIGLSFLFVALDFMKDGMAGLVQQFDLSQLSDSPALLFVLAGLIITFLIQSSTATMALTLSALYSRAIQFDAAVAIVIGSELGTSLKLILASLGSSADKKRLATGNILLNLATTLIAYVFMLPLIRLIVEVFGVKDNLQALVVFQLLINTMATLLFLPFLSMLSDRLKKSFREDGQRASLYIDHKVPRIPSLALEIFRLEVTYFVKRVLAFGAAEFKLVGTFREMEQLFTEKEWVREASLHQQNHRYRMIRQTQGELIEYYAGMQKTGVGRKETDEAGRLMEAVQEAMHAAKGFKDIAHNKNELLQSGNDVKFVQFNFFSEIVMRNLSRLGQIMRDGTVWKEKSSTQKFLDLIRGDYSETLAHIYQLAGKDAMPEQDISTLQNLNRELFSVHKAMIQSIAHLQGDNGILQEDAVLPTLT